MLYLLDSLALFLINSNLPSQDHIWLIGYRLHMMVSNIICLLYSLREWAFTWKNKSVIFIHIQNIYYSKST